MIKSRILLTLFFIGCIVMLNMSASEANNGMENIGFGAKSQGMGGTSIAVGDDTAVMNTNPAAISKVEGGRIDMGLEMMFPFFSFKNPVEDTDGKRPIYLIPVAGVAYHKKESKWAFGLGMFNEGGTGTDYGVLRVDNDVLGPGIGITNIEYFSNFGFMKLTPTVTYKITDRISVGVTPNIGYAMMRMKMPFFEPTMNRFWAADMDGNDITFSGKIGLLYNVDNRYGFGIAYTTPTDINLEGDVTMTTPTGDMSGMGFPQQSVMQGDLKMEIGWPQSVKAGTFLRVKQLREMVIAFDVEWLNWSDYYKEIPVTMTHVTFNGVPQPNRKFKMKTDWEDQWVFKLGAEYPATKNLNLRMGYIYGKNPVPSRGALAIMNPFVEHHITGGAGYKINDNFEFNMALVYGFNKDVNVGPTHNFAPDMRNSTTGMEFISMSMMVSYKW